VYDIIEIAILCFVALIFSPLFCVFGDKKKKEDKSRSDKRSREREMEREPGKKKMEWNGIENKDWGIWGV
jgi:hypothetical protein